ncbi:MAG: hypothetical protein LBG26_01540 [Treponema sp.]|jgi:hypothetical protein|nr:hypothetical protein [Treponema sp.]
MDLNQCNRTLKYNIKNKPVKKRLITKTGVMMFTEALQNETWDMTLSSVEVDASFNAFLNKGGLILLGEKCSTENLIERIKKELLTSFHCEYQQRN